MIPYCRAREKIVTDALEAEATHLLFLDSDMVFPIPCVQRLLEVIRSRDTNAVSAGMYFQRGFPFAGTWAKMDSKGNAFMVGATEGVHELDACGMGLTMLNLSWLREHLPQPWFRNEWSPDNRAWEDYGFCKRVRESGGHIVGVGDLQCGHVLKGGVVSNENVDRFRTFYAPAMGLKEREA
jgi:hypothetical protein